MSVLINRKNIDIYYEYNNVFFAPLALTTNIFSCSCQINNKNEKYEYSAEQLTVFQYFFFFYIRISLTERKIGRFLFNGLWGVV